MSIRSNSPDQDDDKDPFTLSDGFEPKRGSVRNRIKFLEQNGVQNMGTRGRLRRSVSLQETSSTQLRKLQNAFYTRTSSNVSSRATTPRGSFDDLRSKIPTPTQGVDRCTSVESVAESTSSLKPKKSKPSKAAVLMERCDNLQRKIDALQDVCNSLSDENKTYREEQNISNEHLTTLNETCDTLQRKMDAFQTWCNSLIDENERLKANSASVSARDAQNLNERIKVLEARVMELNENKVTKEEMAASNGNLCNVYGRKCEELKQERQVILNNLKQEITRVETSLVDKINGIAEELSNERDEREKLSKLIREVAQRKQQEVVDNERQKMAEREQHKTAEERKRLEQEQKKASESLKIEIQTMSRRLERMNGDFKQNVDKLECRMLEKFKEEENIVKETLEKLEMEKFELQTQLREASVRSDTLTAEQARYKEYLRNIKLSQQAVEGTSSLRRSFFRRSSRSKKKESMAKLIEAIGPDGSVAGSTGKSS